MELGWDHSPDLDHPDLHRLNAVAAALDEARARLVLNGVCRQDAIGLESLVPGMLMGANPNSFTVNTSNTKLAVALEAIDLKKFAIVGTAVTVAIGILLKFFFWLKELWKKYRERQVTEAALKEAEQRLTAMRDFLAAEIAKSENKEPDINDAASALIAHYAVGDFSKFLFVYIANEVRRQQLKPKDAEHICKEITKLGDLRGETRDDLIRYTYMYGLISSKSAYLQPIVGMLLPACRPKDVTKHEMINYTTSITYGYLAEILELVEGTYRASRDGRPMLNYVEGISIKLRDFCEKFNGKTILPYHKVWRITYDLEERTVNTQKGGLTKIIYPRNHQVGFDPEVIALLDYFRENRSRRMGLHTYDHDNGLESFDKEGIQLLNALAQESQREIITRFGKKLKTLAQASNVDALIKVLERIEKDHAWFLDHYKAEVFDTVHDQNPQLVAIKHLSITEVVDNAIAFVKSAIMATKAIEELNFGLVTAGDQALRLFTNAARDTAAFIHA